jgi:hypothetical protein
VPGPPPAVPDETPGAQAATPATTASAASEASAGLAAREIDMRPSCLIPPTPRRTVTAGNTAPRARPARTDRVTGRHLSDTERH